MALDRRLAEIAAEAAQEGRRIASVQATGPVRIRLKKSSPQVQELISLVATLADMVLIGDITVMRNKVPGAQEAVLQALRNCGVPVDEFLPGVTAEISPATSAIETGLGFLRTFIPAVQPDLADKFRHLEEVLLTKAEETAP